MVINIPTMCTCTNYYSMALERIYWRATCTI